MRDEGFWSLQPCPPEGSSWGALSPQWVSQRPGLPRRPQERGKAIVKGAEKALLARLTSPIFVCLEDFTPLRTLVSPAT